MQTYAGQPVLTWWEGIATGGRGTGEGVIADASYRVIARVRTGNGVRMDLHEFTLTPRGTALVIAYHDRARDLRAWGGSKRGRVTDGVVQEIDVATGRVLFQWNAMGSVPLTDTYRRITRGRTPWDAFHLNSVDEEPDGDLLVSARHTNTVYEIDRATGKVRSRIGGKRSSFKMGEGTRFGLQHDARAQADGTIRIFDNGLRGERRRSRALWIRLDRQAGTATLARSVQHPLQILAGTQGNAQPLPNGDTFFGWGSQGRHLRAEPRRGAAARPAPAARLRHLPCLPPALGGSAGDVAGDRGGDAPRRRHHGLRELERRHGGRGVAGPHGRLRGDAAGRRHRPATRVRDADPAPARWPRGAGPRARRERRRPGAVARRLLVAPPGKITDRGAVSRLQDGGVVKVTSFHFMPYRELPDDADQRYPSMWVDAPWWELGDAEKVGDFYNQSIDELMLAAKLGFDGLGTNEHHQNAYGFMCNPNLFGAILARLTRDLGYDDVAIVQLGATIAATPPIRIAEEYAILDCISGGRLVAGLPLGLGCDADVSYSVTPIEQRERWREAIDFLIKAWTAKEFFAWNGKHYQYRKVNLWPRPIQDPHPPLIIPGAASSSTWDYCHARDIPYAYLSYFGGKSSQAVMNRFWDRAEENGRDRNPYRGRVPPARRRRRHRRAGRGAVRRARRVLLQEAAALPAAVPGARPATATTRACSTSSSRGSWSSPT